MALKIIGAGLGRTGTVSLKQALEALGVGRCYHMREIARSSRAAEHWLRAAEGQAVAWDQVFEGFSATADWPSAPFYEELARYYPGAKVILTVRDPDEWFDSTQKTVFSVIEQLAGNPEDPYSRMIKRIVVDAFDGRVHDRAHVIKVFHAHNARVKEVIPPERLLVYEVREGWGPLCRFLGLAEPAIPFPRSNAADEFARVAAARAAEHDPA